MTPTERGGRRWLPAVVAVVLAAAGVVALVAVSSRGEQRPSAAPTIGLACRADAHLSRAAAALRSRPAAVRIALVGDSTRSELEPPTAGLYRRLREQTGRGGGLAGMSADDIGDFGVRGITVHTYVTDPARLARVAAFAPTLIDISIGINDLRVDQSAGPRVQADLLRLVGTLRGAVPDADILLSVPAALSAVDVGRRHLVVDGSGAVNPPGAADRVTTELRDAYLQVARETGYVGLNDVQREVTGTRADTAAPPRYLVDQLHPSAATSARIADTIVGALTGSCPTPSA
jgi:lysophospholipase L1-like esterase